MTSPSETQTTFFQRLAKMEALMAEVRDKERTSTPSLEISSHYLFSKTPRDKSHSPDEVFFREEGMSGHKIIQHVTQWENIHNGLNALHRSLIALGQILAENSVLANPRGSGFVLKAAVGTKSTQLALAFASERQKPSFDHVSSTWPVNVTRSQIDFFKSRLETLFTPHSKSQLWRAYDGDSLSQAFWADDLTRARRVAQALHDPLGFDLGHSDMEILKIQP